MNSNEGKILGRRPTALKDWAPDFIGAILEGDTVRDACKFAGVDISLPYKRRTIDPEFREAWQEAMEVGTELMEYEAARRAYHGNLEPVFYKGEEVGAVRKYSDVLLMFLLKGRKPDTYRDSSSVTVNQTTNNLSQTNDVTVNVFNDIQERIKLIEQVDSQAEGSIRQNGAVQPMDEAQPPDAQEEPKAD